MVGLPREDLGSKHVNGSYGKEIGAEGFGEYIRCLEERQKRELRILNGLPMRKFVEVNDGT